MYPQLIKESRYISQKERIYYRSGANIFPSKNKFYNKNKNINY